MPRDPAHVFLGHVEPSELEQFAWLERLVQEFREALKAKRVTITQEMAEGGIFKPATWAEFVEGVKRRREFERQLNDGGVKGNYEVLNVALHTSISRPDLYGYILYLRTFFNWCGYHDAFMEAKNYSPIRFMPDRVREGHTSIVGGSNSGKSELMKVLAWNDITNGNRATIIIDPHGVMARQVARWPEVIQTGKLVFLGRETQGATARINPLDGRGLSPSDKGKAAQMIVSALGDLVDNADTTARMHTIALQCVRVLLDAERATLWDLLEMLSGKGGKWVELAKKHPSRSVSMFFQHEFLDPAKEVSRAGLRDRLWHLLSDDDFVARFCQPSTVDLAAEIERQKVIIFDLGEIVGRANVAATRLVLGTLASMGRRRIAGTLPRSMPVHIHLDEASKMLGGSATMILEEMRKARMFLTLAQQGENAMLRERTAVRFAGGSTWKHVLAGTAAMHGKNDKNTSQGVFWMKWGHEDPARVEIMPGLLNDKNSVSRDAWRKAWNEQRAKYYRPVVDGHAGVHTEAQKQRPKQGVPD